MSAEQIVRALAATDPCVRDDSRCWHECGLCHAGVPLGPEHHAIECPWRLASEWVQAERNARAGQVRADQELYGAAYTMAGQRVDPTTIRPSWPVCPACGQEEPPPTTDSREALPEVIACRCSSCGTELWWNSGTWRQF